MANQLDYTLDEWLREVRLLLGEKAGMMSTQSGTNMWVEGLTPDEAAAAVATRLKNAIEGDF